MTKLEFACKLLEIESNATMARAQCLVNNNSEVLKHLLVIRDSISNLCLNIVSKDEQHLYLAK